MSPGKLFRPTDAELEILHILWEQGAATVREVHAVMAVRKSLTYTTTLKLLQIMLEKGLVTRDDSQRSHVYTAKIQQQKTQRQFVRELIDKVFGGATEQLVLQALSARKVSTEEIAEIRKLLDELEARS